MNRFSYRSIYSLGEYVYTWKVEIDGTVLEGSASSIRKTYRQARKEIKRYRKMEKFLNPETS